MFTVTQLERIRSQVRAAVDDAIDAHIRWGAQPASALKHSEVVRDGRYKPASLREHSQLERERMLERRAEYFDEVRSGLDCVGDE